MGTILDRGYVFKKGTALVPSFLAFAVVTLLEQHFGQLVDYEFTAHMEDVLDEIARGEAERVPVAAPVLLRRRRRRRRRSGPEGPGQRHQRHRRRARSARSRWPARDIVVRVGRYGPYLERDGQRVNIPEDIAPDELTVEKAEELFDQPNGDVTLGTDPDSGREVVAKAGRFGPYVTELLPEGAPTSAKPRTASLLKSMALDTVTLDDALKLLSLPRTLGELDGEPVTVQNGRYGPYVKKGTDSRSLESEEQLFTLTLDEAKELFAQPKARGRRTGAAAPPLRELGEDPVSGQADGDQGRPVRPLRHRRGDQRVAAQGRRGGVDHDRSAAAELLADRGGGPTPSHRAAGPAARPAKRADRAKRDAPFGARDLDLRGLQSRSRTNPLCGLHCRYAYAVNFRAGPIRATPTGEALRRRRAASHAREPGVLSIRPFRRLWIALSLSSLGDWLSIVALTALAPSLASSGAAAKSSAVGGVWWSRCCPRCCSARWPGRSPTGFDRRMTMIVGDVDPRPAVPVDPAVPEPDLDLRRQVPGRGAPRCSGIRPPPPRSRTWCRRTSWSGPTSSACSPRTARRRSRPACSRCSRWSAGRSAGSRRCSTPSNVDLALYFNAASYGVSALTIFFTARDPQAQRRAARSPCRRWPSRSGRAGGSSARRRWCAAWSIGMLGAFAAARRGGRPRLRLHQRHAARRQRRLGPGLRRDLRRHGARHVPRHHAARRASAAGGCSASSIAAAAVPLALIGLVPGPAWSSCSWSLLGALSGHRVGDRLHARRPGGGRRAPAAGSSRSSSPPSR